MIKPVTQLATLFRPSSYTLTLDLTQRVQRVFSGEVTITGELTKAAKDILLHSKDLTITAVQIDGTKAVWRQDKDDVLNLTSNTQLTKGKHIVRVQFSGKITNPMHGLYPCYFKHDGQDKELLMTQLESHHAREVFPCIDEPAAKATVDLTLITEPGITALANTPVASSQTKGGVLTTIFQTTPKMSTYLLAFVVGELAYKETTSESGILIRCYATPDHVEHTEFALGFAAKALDFYDDFFALPYPLPKCDLVAVPDFAAGAMENWGLITFRENALLYDTVNSAADLKEWIAAVVAHELAHQWFGNLVTMKWWDDLWLNESFAKWMEHYAVDKLMPQWRVWDSFGAHEQQYAFNRDSLANVQAVRQPVSHPDELTSLFDPAIVYAKGACLIRMLQNYLGEEPFKKGLRLYMQRHQYANAQADDLWDALDEVAGKDVKQFMRTWLELPGHPVVSARLEGDTLALSQKRFYSNPTQAKTDNTAWPLPLSSSSLEAALLDSHKATFAVRSTPVLLNKGYTGFYHTHYDAAMLADIAVLIANDKLPVIERQGLLVDSLALTKAGQQSTTDLLSLLASYRQESSYPIWQAMGSVIGAIRMLVNDDPGIKPNLQRYIAALATPQFERLGWERVKDEPYFDELLRPTPIALLAYAQDTAVVEHALRLFDAAKKPEDIAMPELRSIIYSVAMRERGRPAFEQLLDWYKHAQSAEERVNLVAGISSLRDPQLASEATKLFTTNVIKLQDLIYWIIHFIRSRHARPAAWQWIQDNWEWIERQFKNSHDYSDFPKAVGSAFSTREELAQYKAFFEPKLKEQDIALVIRQGIEDIEVRTLWRERDLAALSAFLKDGN